MRVESFDYHLPPELIAQKPLEPRDSSLLMVVDCQARRVQHRRFSDLEDYIGEGDCMVFNSSRVRRARLLGYKKEGGGRVELLLLKHREGGVWEALARPSRRLRPGTSMVFEGGLEGELIEKGERGWCSVSLYPGEPEVLESILERIGDVPLPPYIKQGLADPERYQTVFADQTGSAAAPTAGLHFSSRILNRLRQKGVGLAFLRLDVGLDTFRPLQEEEVEQHRLHSEEMVLGEEACAIINGARRKGKKVVAVGTTVVRALESSVSGGDLVPFSGATDLFIYPGFEFKAVDCLVSNFHLPRSSLLLLVCAFAGRDLVMESYRQAVERRYRFLSFGDVCYFHFPRGRGKN